MTYKENQYNQNFILSSYIIIQISAVMLISAAALFLKLKLDWPILALSHTISIFYLFIINKNYKTSFLKSFLILTFIYTVIYAFAGYIFDLSYDGMCYHQEAIVRLAKEGWNPFYGDTNHLLLDHYSKGPWLYSAVLYNTFGNIEFGKSYHILYLVAAFMLLYSSLLKVQTLTVNRARILSIITVFSIPVITQSLTFYVDGFIGTSYLVILTLTSLLISRQNKYLWYTLIAAILSGINIKFTGLVYTVVILFFGFSYILLIKKDYKLLKKYILICSITGLIGTFFLGFNPYYTNIRDHGHPFYPVAGKDKIPRIIKNHTPTNFVGKNRVYKLFYSLYATTSRPTFYKKTYANLKIPFTIINEDFKSYASLDNTTSGFGIFFSGVLSLTILLGIITGIRLHKNQRKAFYSYTFILGTIIASILINPESWWARFAPQVWFIPIAIILFSFIYHDKLFTKKEKPYVNTALIVCIFFSLAPLVLSSWTTLSTNLRGSIKGHNYMSELAKRNKFIKVYFDDFPSNRTKLNYYDIKYWAVKKKNGLKHPKRVFRMFIEEVN